MGRILTKRIRDRKQIPLPAADRTTRVVLRNRRSLLVTIVAAIACGHIGAAPTSGDEPAIVEALGAYFASDDSDRRDALVRQIESDPAYARDKVSVWLHAASSFDPIKHSTLVMRIPIGRKKPRTVRLRLPKGYDAGRAWPLLMVYHGSGGNAKNFLRFVEQLLGEQADEFIIAAPHDYRQTVVDLPGPPSAEHPTIRHAIRQRVHVDSDRMYSLGYSLGGYATWTFATLHADRFAGAIALASTFSFPSEGALWEAMLPNLNHVPILHVWGGKDPLPCPGFGGRRARMTISQLNRRFAAILPKIDANITSHMLPEKGHGGVTPAPDQLQRILARRRVRNPRHVEHTFRHLYQGLAYWLQAETWLGDRWDTAFHQEVLRELNTSDDAEEIIMRKVVDRMARLVGTLRGQSISIRRRHVGDLVVWFSEDLIDWTQPVKVVVDDATVFEGAVKPNLHACLEQARTTLDFDRLRWAGLRVSRDGKAEVITKANPATKPPAPW